MLLLTLVLTFWFEGIAEPGALKRPIGTVLAGATLLLALFAAQTPVPRLRLVAALDLIVVVGAVTATVAGKGATVAGAAAIANALLLAVAPPAIVIGLLRNLRARGTVTITVVTGVLCLYLLVGLLFAYAFAAVQNLGGAPFFANGDAATSTLAVYFSFVTLTTVGYGDFTARTNLGLKQANGAECRAVDEN